LLKLAAFSGALLTLLHTHTMKLSVMLSVTIFGFMQLSPAASAFQTTPQKAPTMFMMATMSTIDNPSAMMLKMSMMDKPSAAKQSVLHEKYSIDRSRAKQAVKRAACEKQLQELGSPPDIIDPIIVEINNDIIDPIIVEINKWVANAKEDELCKLEDELMTSLKKGGCFSLATVSLLIKYNAKANEKRTTIDLLANLQSVTNAIFASSTVYFLTTSIQAIKANQGE
jgi:hypothetical protein